MTYEETKQLYLAYRAKAKELSKLASFGPVSVSDHANVQLAEGGAFVECIVWIAKEQL